MSPTTLLPWVSLGAPSARLVRGGYVGPAGGVAIFASPADADFAALAANSHADLVTALVEIERIACRSAASGRHPEDEPEPANRDGEELATIARAALAKARGGQ